MSGVDLYPLDMTGTAVSNKVVNERHTLKPPQEVLHFHFILPMAAPFFRNSVQLKHIGTNRTLVRGVDWIPAFKFHSASYELQEVGGGVYGAVLLTDKTLSGQVEFVTYQTLGGEWTLNENKILEILSNRATDPRLLTYEEVNGKPDVFPPQEHQHPVDDLTGMGDVVSAAYDIAAAIRERTQTFLDNPPILLGEYYTKDQIDAIKAVIDQAIENAVTGTLTDYYSATEVNNLLLGKLATTAAAADATKAFGMTQVQLTDAIYQSVINQIVTGGAYYSASEIDTKLLGKLDSTATAANAAKVYNLTQTQLLAYIASNLDLSTNTLVSDLTNVIEVTADTTLAFGKRYFVKANVTLTLPDISSRTANGVVHLMKATGVAPTIVVNPLNTGTQIGIGASNDTSLSYDVNRQISMVYDLSDAKWYV